MKENDEELMRRYIYQVVRRMPKAQAEEIRMELEELISDMMESKNCTMEEALTELGNPKEFAKKYQNQSHYLISPEYFDTYCFILKIVLVCFGAIALLSAITTYNYSSFEMVDYIVDLIVDTLSNMFMGFANVTIIFAIIEYCESKNKINVSTKNPTFLNSTTKSTDRASWKPEDLTPIPVKKSMISRGDSVVGIIVFTVLCALFIYQPELIGMCVFEDHQLVRSIPVFQISEWSRICPYFICIFCLGLIDEIIKLATGCYCKLVMVVNIITNVLQVIIAAVLLKVLPIWNPSFTADVTEAVGRNFDSKGDLFHYWDTSVISNVTLAIFVIIAVVEITCTVYKTVRYSNQ